ncbi:MAG: ChbG/HpnK family deacetylase [Bacteroidales bacterium]|nr:ChbG/HpnK family deacetylase [Bacteroidales bacterium]
MLPRLRPLVVTADDFGIGPETTRGILDLAARGIVTSTVLLVNSPHATEAVRLWRKLGARLELGWHPCLTLDRPILPPAAVPSLIGSDGQFHPLPRFLKRLIRQQLAPTEIHAELSAQLERFQQLVQSPPAVVNGHHHLHVFPIIGPILRALLANLTPRPYLRRVVESSKTELLIPGARIKRFVMSSLGRRAAHTQQQMGFSGTAVLAGLGGALRSDPRYFIRWLQCVPGPSVELICHPGYHDMSLTGRDERISERVREWELLKDPRLRETVAQAGFQLVSGSALAGHSPTTQQAG